MAHAKKGKLERNASDSCFIGKIKSPYCTKSEEKSLTFSPQQSEKPKNSGKSDKKTKNATKTKVKREEKQKNDCKTVGKNVKKDTGSNSNKNNKQRHDNFDSDYGGDFPSKIKIPPSGSLQKFSVGEQRFVEESGAEKSFVEAQWTTYARDPTIHALVKFSAAKTIGQCPIALSKGAFERRERGVFEGEVLLSALPSLDPKGNVLKAKMNVSLCVK